MASLGNIVRPCSAHTTTTTTTTENLKAEKKVYFILIKKLLFFSSQDKMNILASKFQTSNSEKTALWFWAFVILGT